MTLWSRMRSWLQATLRRSRMESEMDAELCFHVEAYAEDLTRGGVPRQEAMRRARLEFGGVERAKEECREARGVNLVGEPKLSWPWPRNGIHKPRKSRWMVECWRSL